MCRNTPSSTLNLIKARKGGCSTICRLFHSPERGSAHLRQENEETRIHFSGLHTKQLAIREAELALYH